MTTMTKDIALPTIENTVLVGIQWGDEGKAKMIDVLAPHFDAVVRFQGGNNAGHTIVVGQEKTVLHLIPSGILHKHTTNIIANGVVFDLEIFLKEVEQLNAKGIDVSPKRLQVSELCHVILPTHRALDRARENSRLKIGTTGRGIGPTYGDKAMRLGVRLGDFYQPARLKTFLEPIYQEKVLQLKEMGSTEIPSFADVFDRQLELFERVRPHLIDSSRTLNRMILEGKHILFEGAQGTLLDVDYGTYPYVTSSNTTAGFAGCGTGVGPKHLHQIIGLTKAYTTRVGSGPFVTECLNDDSNAGALIAKRGHEFGSTTGRARRCGWLDLVALKRAVELNSVTGLALSKLDVLSGFETIKVATGYRVNGQIRNDYPQFQIEESTAVYEELSGWPEFSPSIKDESELPKAVTQYIQLIEDTVKVPVTFVSTGPERDHILYRLGSGDKRPRAMAQS